MIHLTSGMMGKGMMFAEPVDTQELVNHPDTVEICKAIESLPPLARVALVIHITLLAQRKLLSLLDGVKK